MLRYLSALPPVHSESESPKATRLAVCKTQLEKFDNAFASLTREFHFRDSFSHHHIPMVSWQCNRFQLPPSFPKTCMIPPTDKTRSTGVARQSLLSNQKHTSHYQSTSNEQGHGNITVFTFHDIDASDGAHDHGIHTPGRVFYQPSAILVGAFGIQ